MSQRSMFWGLLACFAPLLVACGGQDDVESAGHGEAPFSTAPEEPNHENITLSALGFLRPEILDALVAANVETDVQFVLVSANHFDDCNFSGGSLVVSSNQAAAVQDLDPGAASLEKEAEAIVHFARSLHAVQDFYAHTNWIESGGQVLVDSTLESFPTFSGYQAVPSTGFVLVQGRKPKSSALYRNDDAPYPDSAVVTYRTGSARKLGVISGTVDYEAGDYCPDSVAMTHAELNKDKSTNVGREAEYESAKALAIQQTAHEWCRLRALMSAAYGDAGTARLDAWVADATAAPNCGGQ